MRMLTFVLLGFATLSSIESKNDGLALKPPMGWLAWTRFMCQIDCEKFPKHCISENLFVDMANILVSEGYKAVGYDRINIDDCWMARERDKDGRLQADSLRFPRGIKWLADYMHERGLKLGIYTNVGLKTCMGFPGSQEFLERDAETFASWEVDMLKLDGCFTEPKILDDAYPKMGGFLNASGRQIVYSCSWPYYTLTVARTEPDYNRIRQNCHLWRNFDDIAINFVSIARIIEYYDQNQDRLAPLHGPGSWNDPDGVTGVPVHVLEHNGPQIRKGMKMLIVGNPELTLDYAKVQMAMWCLWSAPLLMSNDLREIRPEFKALLLNKRLIAINQDSLGVMGKLVLTKGLVNIYVKPVTPFANPRDSVTKICSYAIVCYNKDLRSTAFEVTLAAIGLHFKDGYDIVELFSGDLVGRLMPGDNLKVALNATSAIIFKATVNLEPSMQLFDLVQVKEDSLSNYLGSLFRASLLPYAVMGSMLILLLSRRRVLRGIRRLC